MPACALGAGSDVSVGSCEEDTVPSAEIRDAHHKSADSRAGSAAPERMFIAIGAFPDAAARVARTGAVICLSSAADAWEVTVSIV